MRALANVSAGDISIAVEREGEFPMFLTYGNTPEGVQWLARECEKRKLKQDEETGRYRLTHGAAVKIISALLEWQEKPRRNS